MYLGLLRGDSLLQRGMSLGKLLLFLAQGPCLIFEVCRHTRRLGLGVRAPLQILPQGSLITGNTFEVLLQHLYRLLVLGGERVVRCGAIPGPRLHLDREICERVGSRHLGF